jgi:hypothetical protein
MGGVRLGSSRAGTWTISTSVRPLTLFTLLLTAAAVRETDRDPRQGTAARGRCVREAPPYDLRHCQEALITCTVQDAAQLAAAISARAAAAAVNDSLREVQLDGSSLLDEGVITLAPALRQVDTLLSLHAYNTQLGDNGAESLAMELYAHPTLLTLDLSGNFIGTPRPLEPGAYALTSKLTPWFVSRRRQATKV